MRSLFAISEECDDLYKADKGMFGHMAIKTDDASDPLLALPVNELDLKSSIKKKRNFKRPVNTPKPAHPLKGMGVHKKYSENRNQRTASGKMEEESCCCEESSARSWNCRRQWTDTGGN